MALKLNASAVYGVQKLPLGRRTQSGLLNFKPNLLHQNPTKMLCSMNMAAGQSDEPKILSMNDIMDKARNLWDNSPQPVKSFPWDKTLANFIQLILDIVLTVIKYLFVPIFAITSISEMSYCAHERKLFVLPFPFLAGVAVAGILRNAALESSPYLKLQYAEVPWHLIGVVVLCALLKFPGPYYPYWGRIFIPHFANGALLRTLWFMFLWYRRPRKTSENNQTDSTMDNPVSNEA